MQLLKVYLLVRIYIFKFITFVSESLIINI